MNFYKLNYKESCTEKFGEPLIKKEGGILFFDDMPNKIEWFSNERDAVRRRLELYNAGKLMGAKKGHTIEIHNIPVRKQELLEWLRRECV